MITWNSYGSEQTEVKKIKELTEALREISVVDLYFYSTPKQSAKIIDLMLSLGFKETDSVIRSNSGDTAKQSKLNIRKTFAK